MEGDGGWTRWTKGTWWFGVAGSIIQDTSHVVLSIHLLLFPPGGRSREACVVVVRKSGYFYEHPTAAAAHAKDARRAGARWHHGAAASGLERAICICVGFINSFPSASDFTRSSFSPCVPTPRTGDRGAAVGVAPSESFAGQRERGNGCASARKKFFLRSRGRCVLVCESLTLVARLCLLAIPKQPLLVGCSDKGAARQ